MRDAVHVVEGDMREPAVDGRFDLIAVPFNSLAYLIAREDRLACLRSARELLAPGGRLAFDLIQPRYDFLAEALQSCPPLRVDVDHPAPEYGVARFLRTYTTSTTRATRRCARPTATRSTTPTAASSTGSAISTGTSTSRRSSSCCSRPPGCTVVERFGDYDRGPWTATSRRYLWLAEAG